MSADATETTTTVTEAVTLADPYSPPDADAPAAPPPPAPTPADQRAHRRARAQERLGSARAVVEVAERTLASELDAQGRHAAFEADYAAAITAANEELKTCDDDAVDAIVTRRDQAEKNRRVHADRVAARQIRIDAANAALESAQEAVEKEQLVLARIELEELDAEAVALAIAAEQLVGDIFDRLVAKARAAETLANSIESRRLGTPASITITSPIQNVAERTEPQGSANTVQRAGAVLAWHRDQPRQEFEMAELRRRSQPPPPGIAAGVSASQLVNGRHPLFGVPDHRARTVPNTFSQIVKDDGLAWRSEPLNVADALASQPVTSSESGVVVDED